VAGCCECGDEPSGSCSTELVSYISFWWNGFFLVINTLLCTQTLLFLFAQNFVVRQSSQPDTMAISVRLPAGKGPYIEHYLIQAFDGQLSLESSDNRFSNIPSLIAHYSQCWWVLYVRVAFKFM
jgi:hypothetical protein